MAKTSDKKDAKTAIVEARAELEALRSVYSWATEIRRKYEKTCRCVAYQVKIHRGIAYGYLAYARTSSKDCPVEEFWTTVEPNCPVDSMGDGVVFDREKDG